LAQVYIAGAATFVNPANWAKHIEFVHLFGFTIPLLMLIFAFIGRLPRRSLIQVMGVMITIFLMYFTANITRTLPWAGALHPVVAVVIAGQSIAIVTNAWYLIFKNNRGELTE
jgi:mercuric ion transport protein